MKDEAKLKWWKWHFFTDYRGDEKYAKKATSKTRRQLDKKVIKKQLKVEGDTND